MSFRRECHKFDFMNLVDASSSLVDQGARLAILACEGVCCEGQVRLLHFIRMQRNEKTEVRGEGCCNEGIYWNFNEERRKDWINRQSEQEECNPSKTMIRDENCNIHKG